MPHGLNNVRFNSPHAGARVRSPRHTTLAWLDANTRPSLALPFIIVCLSHLEMIAAHGRGARLAMGALLTPVLHTTSTLCTQWTPPCALRALALGPRPMPRCAHSVQTRFSVAQMHACNYGMRPHSLSAIQIRMHAHVYVVAEHQQQ